MSLPACRRVKRGNLPRPEIGAACRNVATSLAVKGVKDGRRAIAVPT
jgi:hypothetical protein